MLDYPAFPSCSFVFPVWKRNRFYLKDSRKPFIGRLTMDQPIGWLNSIF